MPQSYFKVALHVVFSTKNREPLITRKLEFSLYKFLKVELLKMECISLKINGMPDHIHMLFLQNPKTSILDTIKQIKGASSYWINQQKLTENKFAWQGGYAVFSVSESQIKKVSDYIRNQKLHHSNMNYEDEMKSFKELHNL